MNPLKRTWKGLDVFLVNEACYSVNSTDNVRTYDAELCRDGGYDHSCAHGVLVGDPEHPASSVVCLGVGGVTKVHPDAFTISGDCCYVAAGDAVFALELPTLHCRWMKKVDFATCFGVCWVSAFDCLITWGELVIRRLHSDGETVWQRSGPEIYTEAFALADDHIIVTDFDGAVHRISIEEGVFL